MEEREKCLKVVVWFIQGHQDIQYGISSSKVGLALGRPRFKPVVYHRASLILEDSFLVQSITHHYAVHIRMKGDPHIS